MFIYVYVYDNTHVHIYMYKYLYIYMQPKVDRVSQDLEIISKTMLAYQNSTHSIYN